MHNVLIVTLTVGSYLFVTQSFRSCFHLVSQHVPWCRPRNPFHLLEPDQCLICPKPPSLNPSQTLINALAVWEHARVMSPGPASDPGISSSSFPQEPPPLGLSHLLASYAPNSLRTGKSQVGFTSTSMDLLTQTFPPHAATEIDLHTY